jgi:hypothetical protein
MPQEPRERYHWHVIGTSTNAFGAKKERRFDVLAYDGDDAKAQAAEKFPGIELDHVWCTRDVVIE